MTEKLPSKDEALEALDFIVNVLKEHEKDLDRLVNELGTVADQMGETSELTGKFEKIEEKINGLQGDVSNLVKCFSASPREPQVVVPTAAKEPRNESAARIEAGSGIPVLFQCKQWEDFQVLAAQAQTVSFTFKETERTFEVDALKNNQVIKFSGENPKVAALLKSWLSKELEISEKKILEGVLAIG
jgi:hypothetical protein